MRVAPKIELTDEERAALTKLWRSGLTSVRLAQRARIILLADQGLNNKDIAAQLGIGRMQPARWRERYLQGGIKAIERDLPRGAPPVPASSFRASASMTITCLNPLSRRFAPTRICG